MSRNLSEDLKYLNQRLELGVEWVQRPVVYRSLTPPAEHNESPPRETTSYDDVVQAHEKAIRDYPGDNYPLKIGNESHYRMVPKKSLGVVNAPQDVQHTSNSETTTRRTRALQQTFHPILYQRASSTRRSVDFGSIPSSNINIGHKHPRQRRTINRVVKPRAQAQKRQSRTAVGNQPLRRSERIAALQRTSKLRVYDSHRYKAFRSHQGDVDKRKQRTLDSVENVVDGYDSEEQKAGHNTESERGRSPPGRRRPKTERAAPMRSVVCSGRSQPQISPTSTILRRSARVNARRTSGKG